MNGTSSYPGIKAVIIVAVALALLIPVTLLRSIVRERADLAQQVEGEIAEAAGGQLLIAGPALVVPADFKTKDSYETRKVLILPDNLTVVGTAKTELRERGIYSTPVYEGTFDIEATFTIDTKKILDSMEDSNGELRLAEARLALELPDARALRSKAFARFSYGAEIPLIGGLSVFGASGRSLSAPVPLEEGTFGVTTSLKLGGGGSIKFAALADAAAIKLSADWPSPSFYGTAPSFRDLHEKGFSAEWTQAEGGGTFPTVMTDPESRQYLFQESEFGVSLFKSVSLYHKSERALKYALLFIVMPYLVIFLMELFTKGRIHPIQYALIGLADVVFYALLLSISERLPFGAAYWLSALAVTLLIALYASSALKSFKRGLPLIPLLGALYLYLYSALLSEDYALLIGSIGVFAVLAISMYATRKIDWYAIGRRED